LVWGLYDEESGETFVHAQIVPNFEKIKEKFNDCMPSKEQIYSIIKDAVKSANRSMPLYKQIKNFTIKDSEFVKTTTKKIKRYIEKFDKKDKGHSV
jgi:long-chain acyl-CoA synthetase